MPRIYTPSVPTRYDPATESRVSSVDLRPAMQFGDMIVMLPDPLQMNTDNCSKMLDALHGAIGNICPEDFIIAIGDPIIISAAIAYACEINGFVQVLRWDRQTHSYTNVVVVL